MREYTQKPQQKQQQRHVKFNRHLPAPALFLICAHIFVPNALNEKIHSRKKNAFVIATAASWCEILWIMYAPKVVVMLVQIWTRLKICIHYFNTHKKRMKKVHIQKTYRRRKRKEEREEKKRKLCKLGKLHRAVSWLANKKRSRCDGVSKCWAHGHDL